MRTAQRSNKPIHQTMNNEVRRCLREVIDFFIDDEHKHWQESGRPDKHIYKCLEELAAYLNTLEVEED
jgi:hypothetical protein